MPTISLYLLRRFGIKVSMYFLDVKQHHVPHVHAEYGGTDAILEIPSGRLLEDSEMPDRTLRKVRAWIVLHEEALMERWSLASTGQPITRID